MISEDAVVGVCASKCRHEHTDFESYLAHFHLTAAEQAIFNLAAAVWGRPEIEGCMLCRKCEINLHLIEKLHVNGRDIGIQLIGSSGSKYMDEYASCYNYPKMIHILNEGLCNFVPILRKTSEPNKPVEKQTNI